jgi:hypothetical protein
VQLVKDALSLVNGIDSPARVSWRPGHFTPDAAMPVGSDSGLRLALAAGLLSPGLWALPGWAWYATGLRRRLVSRCPVMAVAYRAKSMAPIGVQFVKDTLRLVNGTGGPARRS